MTARKSSAMLIEPQVPASMLGLSIPSTFACSIEGMTPPLKRQYGPRVDNVGKSSIHTSPMSSGPPSPGRQLAQAEQLPPRPPPDPVAGGSFTGDGSQQPSHNIPSTAFSPDFYRKNFVEKGVLGKGGNGVVLKVEHVMGGVSLGHFACKRIPVGML